MFYSEQQILVFNPNYSKLEYYKLFILKHLELGNKIPKRVYEKFFSIYIELKENKEETINFYAISLAKTIEMNFKDNGYCFTDTIDNKYSFSDMIITIVKKYYSILDFTKKWNKEKWMQFLYTEMSEYRETFLTKKDKKNFSKYKMHVLSAFMTKEMGFAISEKKAMTNADLFHAAKNSISKMKDK